MPALCPGLLGAILTLLALAVSVSAAYEEAPVRPSGTLRGSVRFVGVAPRFQALTVTKHREVCGERQPAEILVVGANGGVQGAVIRVEGVTRGKAPAREVVLDTVGCRFIPHVAVAGPGTRILVRNGDPILHNAQGVLDGEVLFNVAIPRASEAIDVTRRLWSPGIVRVHCGVHPHMSAWLVIHDSPYVAVSDGLGSFSIAEIPTGRYRVTLWHEGFRPRRRGRTAGPIIHGPPVRLARTVTIVAGATTPVEFRLH